MAGNRRSSKRRRTRKRRRTTNNTVDVDESSNNGGGVIEKRCLSDIIPSDLWELIMGKLFFADQINFRAVCKLWRSFDNVPPPLKQMPWLMVFKFIDHNLEDPNSSYYDIERERDRDKYGDYNTISWDSCKLFDPTYKKTYNIDMSCLDKKKNFDCDDAVIHESKYGWLLISCLKHQNLTCTTSTYSLFLYSPFFIDDNIFELPALKIWNDAEYIATFDLISNSSKKKEGFEVLVLSSNTYGTICIKTYRQGDNSWSCNKTIWNFQLSKIDCGVYSEGIFYYATRLKKEPEWELELGSYDIVRNIWTKFPTHVSVQPLSAQNLIKLGGEIYLISVKKYIYKFDLSKETWKSIELHDLVDRVLFIGDEYSSILELDNDIQELKDQRQQVYSCCTNTMVMGGDYATVKHSNGSYICTNLYGSHALNKDCKRVWIDPPRRIRNSI